MQNGPSNSTRLPQRSQFRWVKITLRRLEQEIELCGPLHSPHLGRSFTRARFLRGLALPGLGFLLFDIR